MEHTCLLLGALPSEEYNTNPPPEIWYKDWSSSSPVEETSTSNIPLPRCTKVEEIVGPEFELM
jgi:hypothetical protein